MRAGSRVKRIISRSHTVKVARSSWLSPPRGARTRAMAISLIVTS